MTNDNGTPVNGNPAMTVKPRQMEALNRGLIAVKTGQGVYTGWRLLGTEAGESIAFNLYRGDTKVNNAPLTGSTNYTDIDGTADSVYHVCAVIKGREIPPSEKAFVWEHPYHSVPLQKPEGGVSPDGVAYEYSANDASVGDVDGDGEYEIILKWDPSNSHDNAHKGYTGNVYLDCYKLNGAMLWRIDLGRNIRAGAHYTQFLVYDLDGDGKAEMVCKTADGTKDGTGGIIGDPDADYRNPHGFIVEGPEYLTVFKGLTGEALATIPYSPPRGNSWDWGDGEGNRVDRFLACVAYLDGVMPSVVMCRGYYTRTVLAAFNWRDGAFTPCWVFDSDDGIHSAYAGQGNHSVSVADVDGDGFDEIIYGSCVIDHDGTGLYSTGLGHGDAMHAGKLVPGRAGLEVFQVHENPSEHGIEMHDAETGQLLWGVPSADDIGRGLCADIDPRYEGEECWADGKLFNAQGELISDSVPSSTNFAIWWDGDLLRELLDRNRIDKWDYAGGKTVNLFTAEGCVSNNSTKATPCLQADLMGDWREEVVWRTEDSRELRIYTTTDETSHRIYTLMHDPVYRLSIAWQNVAYNQPPHTGFHLGEGMETPPVPAIYTYAANNRPGGVQMTETNQPVIFLAGDSTVQTYTKEYAPQAGWGQFAAEYFTDGVRIDNRAIGGRSSKTFITEGRLEAAAGDMKAGDWLIIQMGHNDSTASRPERYTDPHTDYKQYLTEYVKAARARHATPVFVTPVGRLHYEEGTFRNDFPEYCRAMKDVAKREDVKLVDLMALSLAYYTSVGYEESQSLFMISVNGTDCTHFTEKGARQIAKLVAEGVKELKTGISRYVR